MLGWLLFAHGAIYGCQISVDREPCRLMHGRGCVGMIFATLAFGVCMLCPPAHKGMLTAVVICVTLAIGIQFGVTKPVFARPRTETSDSWMATSAGIATFVVAMAGVLSYAGTDQATRAARPSGVLFGV